MKCHSGIVGVCSWSRNYPVGAVYVAILWNLLQYRKNGRRVIHGKRHMKELTRAALIEQLLAWQTEQLGSEAMWLWALEQRSECKPSDSAVRDALDMLCAIPEDLLLPEDAEVLLDALHNPPDQADLSSNLLWNYADMIDQNGRRQALVQDPFYGPYCGN